MKILKFNHLCLVILNIGFLASCSNPPWKSSDFSGSRKLAYIETETKNMPAEYLEELNSEAQANGHRLEFPPGMNADETNFLWHASEGSEIYPTLWMMNLKSTKSSLSKTSFLEKLDSKFGLIPNEYTYSPYPLKWIGLTAAWSDESPENELITLEPGVKFLSLPKVRKLGSNKQSIAMSGVNCTFCHTGNITYNDGKKNINKIIEGAPSNIDARGFFKDLYGSTIKLMLEEKLLAEFLEKMDVKDSKTTAATFSKEFTEALGAQKTLKTEIVKLLEKMLIIGEKVSAKKNSEVQTLLFKKRDVIELYLNKLLKLTYGFETIPETLQLRMKYFSMLGSPDPALEETASGYGRTDAFGRIANGVAREFNPIALNAPVSMPYMYAMKYKSMFHYNSNTNSVISRNIGQSFGLGSILNKKNAQGPEKFSSTTNLHNLIKMEKIIYKIKVPEYQEIMPELKIDKERAVKGCNLYVNKCMGCHSAYNERVGPAKALINYKVLPLSKIGTDETYIWNQAAPINGHPFRKGIFDFTDNIKKWYFDKYNISPEEVSIWANTSLRGEEIFRDTVNGDDRYKDDPNMRYVSIPAGRGFTAKHLSGIWATAPYLHNGSVANIYELLLPANKRRKIFTVGSTLFDDKNMGLFSGEEKNNVKSCDYDSATCFDTALSGNSNSGHEPSLYGGELKEADKYNLIEFLKVLRPESEYAWTSTPIYKIVNDNCELR